jgi:hypothetical protein
MVRRLFLAWRLFLTRIFLEAARTENARLINRLGNRVNSIWQMTKSELVETARQELGMTVAQATQKTAVVLRELIRRNRKVQADAEDPMKKVPPGLEKMTKDQLETEILLRGLIMPEKPTRPHMILMIRDHVEATILLAQVEETEAGQDEDWQMTEPPCKGRGKSA